jgi:hypothetical protein
VNVPSTALNHFQQDIGRAQAIIVHAEVLPHGTPAEGLLQFPGGSMRRSM